MCEVQPAHGGGGAGRARRARNGRHGIRFIKHPDSIHDARPGPTVPLFVSDSAGDIKVATFEWGFPLDSRPNAVFNTRIESALEQLRRGRRGMWARP